MIFGLPFRLVLKQLYWFDYTFSERKNMAANLIFLAWKSLQEKATCIDCNFSYEFVTRKGKDCLTKVAFENLNVNSVWILNLLILVNSLILKFLNPWWIWSNPNLSFLKTIQIQYLNFNCLNSNSHAQILLSRTLYSNPSYM